jgi:hypothetical protein
MNWRGFAHWPELMVLAAFVMLEIIYLWLTD